MEINLLKNYPKTKRNLEKRSQKTDHDREVAQKFAYDFFDGDRRYGYGGYKYHPKYWMRVVVDMIEHYNLNEYSSILDIGCAKGFMLYDFYKVWNTMTLEGIDVSYYAINHAPVQIRGCLHYGNVGQLSHYVENEFDLVICINTVHNLHPDLCAKAIKEIGKIGKNSFISVDAWVDDDEKQKMMDWNLTAQTMMSQDDWRDLFSMVDYRGDYYWFNP